MGLPGPSEEATSLLEVYCSFALDTKMMAPVYFRNRKKITKSRPSPYLLRDESVLADETPADLVTQLRVFVQYFKWFMTDQMKSDLHCHRGGLRRLRYLSATTYVSRFLMFPTTRLSAITCGNISMLVGTRLLT